MPLTLDVKNKMQIDISTAQYLPNQTWFQAAQTCLDSVLILCIACNN